MGHGIHQMDMLLDVLGDWTEVSRSPAPRPGPCRRRTCRWRTSVRNGAVASVVNSVLSPREESYLRFDFERATVEVTHLYGYGDDDWRVTPAPGCEADVTAAWKHAAGDGDGDAPAVTPPSSPACSPRCATAGARRSRRPRPAARWR